MSSRTIDLGFCASFRGRLGVCEKGAGCKREECFVECALLLSTGVPAGPRALANVSRHSLSTSCGRSPKKAVREFGGCFG